MDLHELDDNAGYIWQGFQHTWNRKVLGFFRTPHRFINLSSQILKEHHSFDQKSLNFEHESQSDLFQSTGVDGDWMRPVMHYGIFHYQVNLGVQILSGPPSNFSAQRIRYEGHKLNPRDRDPLQRSIPGRIAGSGNNQYPSAMIGFREGGFEFQEKGKHSEWSKGRYLSGVGLSVTADSYDTATGVFDFTLLSGFTLPITVKNAWLKVSSELTLLQFANREPQQVLNAQEEGLICINSTDEAPLFSRWKKCEKIAPQQEQ